MDTLDDEILNFWKTLNEHQVKYIMVGGFATNLHGFSRMTADIDIWIKDTLENRLNFRNSLALCGLGDYPEIATLQFVAGFTSFRFKNGFELDVMTELNAFPSTDFDICLKSASIADIESILVPFLHINHLIMEKESTLRPKDQIDLIELKKLRDKRSE